MSTYQIQQKVRTLAKIEAGFSSPGNFKAEINFGNLKFEQWDCSPQDGSLGEAWVVKSDVEADSFEKAYKIFSDKLSELLPVICFTSQCFMEFWNESFLILRKNNNPNNTFLFLRFEDCIDSSLSFGKSEVEMANKIKSFERQQVFRFLQEIINTPNYYARLALIFAVLEVLAGEEEIKTCTCEKGKTVKTYNKEKMKSILGDNDLFNRLFGSNGLRHRLLHGSLEDFALEEDYFSKIYILVVRFFNKEYSIQLPETAVKIPRSFDGKLRLGIFLKADKKIKLQELVGTITSNEYNPGEKVSDYEVVPRIVNY